MKNKKEQTLKPTRIATLTNEHIFRNWPQLQRKARCPVLFIFMDGVGIPDMNIQNNPLIRFGKDIFAAIGRGQQNLIHDGLMVATDPLLSIAGLPQSATGQTALFTGINASQVLNRHVPGFPTITLKKILARHSIFKRLVDAGFLSTLANGYSDAFFDGQRLHHSASTLAYFAGGLPFRSFADIRANEAIFMDITNRYARKLGLHLPLFSMQQSAGIIKLFTEQFDFTMMEYFLTDKAGHTNKWGLARRSIELLEDFLLALLRVIDLTKIQIIVTSDHGNVEDMDSKRHTRNKVPTMLWGPMTTHIAGEITDLVDVHRAICLCLGIGYPSRLNEDY